MNEIAPRATTSSASAVPLTSEEITAYLGLSLSSVCWASAFIAGKLALAELSPLVASTWRHLLATMLLLPFAIRGFRTASFSGSRTALALMIGCGGILYPWTFMSALERTTATNASLLVALNPVFTVLLAPFVGEALSRRRLTGIALALAGAATVVTKGHFGAVTTQTLNSGDLLALAAACLWAVFNLSSCRATAKISPAAINSLVFGCGCIGLGLLSLPQHPLQQLLAASYTALGGLAAMAVLSSVLAGQFFLVGVRTLGVGRTVVFVYLVPVVTAGLAALCLGETIELAQVAGGCAVLGGVYYTAR